MSQVLPDTMEQPGRVGEALRAELSELTRLDISQLRVRWRKLFRREPPGHLPRALMVRIIAYRLQADVHGDLDRDTQRLLDRIARAAQRGEAQPVAAVPDPRKGRLKPGTLLIREHGGEVHHVTALERGFLWRGATYRSLSEIARAITGTAWNGPRFFGLRERSSGGPRS